MVESINKINMKSLLADVKASIRKDRIEEAKDKLKHLYEQRLKAVKIVKNLDREIADFEQELKQDDEDLFTTDDKPTS